MKAILKQLNSRGLLFDSTLKEMDVGPVKVYHGIDPSADCLHLGNLLGLIVLRHFQKMGHTPVLLLGGATGMIGDPSGKSKERSLLDERTLKHNISMIEVLVRKLLPQEPGMPAPIFVNNYDWFASIKFLDFLRDVGKHFRLGNMLSKESVQNRLESSEGMSFTEFCYQTLQAYDFYHLFENEGVRVQCGGSDQWGNITAGCDLISRMSNKNGPVMGLVYPLLTRSDGRKFGKSEEGAIWLSSDRLSPYQFYQYALNTPDSDVIRFMKCLTFMELEEIEEYARGIKYQLHEPNRAQKRYAEELTLLVHGKKGLDEALVLTQAARPGALVDFDGASLEKVASMMPTFELSKKELEQKRLVDLLLASGMVESKAAGRKLIENRGCYINKEQVSDITRSLQMEDLIDGQYVVLSVGKKRRLLVKLIDIKE